MSGDPGGDLDTVSNVLVLAPRLDGAGADACASLLVDGGDALDRLVVVAVGQTPTEWHSRLTQHVTGTLPEIDYIDVKTLTRSTATSTETVDAPAPVATISSPADLVSLGTAINDRLSAAAEQGEHVGLCLHSITDMLQFVDRESVFKFLHAVSARVRNVDAVAYYDLDNDAPDEKLETMFAHLCDTVVSVEGGEMSVSAGYYTPASSESES
ncbi:DUF7504 family protein [Halapricum hydrolyticum]|uniref:Recombinase RecA n=1 Tax=Halapricum hydrolyticum TaxID=2979991 RepID=A0AAE3I9Z9_9EURY|nr:hypothetical protein [Halapricum hydrolyticum]MCU4718356.1 hypothetical protein [Halapricum hydrolyticum]MCU4726531.1 hypothetical protein [Halapricum hydrolyticum]